MNYSYVYNERYNGYPLVTTFRGHNMKSGYNLSPSMTGTFIIWCVTLINDIRRNILKNNNTGYTDDSIPIISVMPTEEEYSMNDTFDVMLVIHDNFRDKADLENKRSFINVTYKNVPWRTFGTYIAQRLWSEFTIDLQYGRYRLKEIIVNFNTTKE